MDFLKKKMKELLDDDDDKSKDKKEDKVKDDKPDKADDGHSSSPHPPEGERSFSEPQSGYYATQQQQPYAPQGGYPGYPPQQYPQPGYGSPSPGDGAPAPPHASLAPFGGPPQLPPGWISQWDQSSQRFYYVEQATGRTQWDPPAFSPAPQGMYSPPPPGPPGPYGQPGHDERGLHGNPYGQSTHDSHGYAGYGHDASHSYGHDAGSHGDKGHKEGKDKKDKKDKDKGHSTGMVVAAGVGGAAVGALVAHELSTFRFQNA